MELKETIDFWRSDIYRLYDVPLARIIGINQSIVVRFLYDKYFRYLKNGTLTAPKEEPEDKYWFYITFDDMELLTGLTHDEQEFAISKLTTMLLIEKKVFECPPKRFFKINIDNLDKVEKFAEKIEFSREDMDSVKSFIQKSILLLRENRKAYKRDIELYGKSTVSTTFDFSQYIDKYKINTEDNNYKTLQSSEAGASKVEACASNQGALPSPSASAPPPEPPTKSKRKPSSSSPSKIKEEVPLWKNCTIVRLTQETYEGLCKIHNQSVTDYYIERVEDFCIATGRRYAGYDGAVRQFIARAKREGTFFDPSGASVASNSGSAVQNKIYKGPADAINSSIAKSPHDVPLEQRPNREVYKINSQLYALYKQKGKDMRGFEDDPSLNAKPFTGKVHNYTPPT